MKSALKIGISWIAVLAGIAVGVCGLAFFGSTPVLGPWTYARAWWLVAAAAIFGLCFLLASAMSLRNRTRAGLLLWAAAPAVGLLVQFSQFAESPEELQISTVPAAVCIVFGGFWLLTRQWPNPLPPIRLPFVARITGFIIVSFFLIAAVSAGAIALVVNAPEIGDCGEGPPNYKPYPDYPVFVARVIHSDRLLGSVAVVQERFWNLRYHTNVVFLKALWKPGDRYFVAGRLSDGLLTRWIFPVINIHCSRSNLIQYATVDLRVLRTERPQSGARIIGTVERLGNYGQAVAGVKVLIEGPQGTLAVTTDQDGIYDVSGLVPGQYEVQPENDEGRGSVYPWCKKMELSSGDVGGCTLRIK